MGPREGQPRPAGGPGYTVRGQPGARGRRSWSQGHPQDTRSQPPPCLPSPPRPQLLSPPQPRHPLTGRGSFPEPAAGSGLHRVTCLQRRDPGQGAGEETVRGRAGRCPARRVGGGGCQLRPCSPRCHYCAQARLPPAATTAEERGGPARGSRGRALTCRHGNAGQLPDGTAQWGADRRRRASHASGETAVLRGPAFRHTLGVPPFLTISLLSVPALVESEYGEGRGPLVRWRKAEGTLLQATASGPSCPRALVVR